MPQQNDACMLRQCLQLLQRHGRTRLDGETLFFNWSLSGFSVRFTGRTLRAQLCAIPAVDIMDPTGQRLEFPWIGVIAPDGVTLTHRIECAEGPAWYTLWEAEEAGEYTIRVVKLSENARGKTGLMALETDGTLLPAEPSHKKTMEIIGDSITCGYGNETGGPDDPFTTGTENGWIAYGALAARELDMELQQLCVSGIGVTGGIRNFTFPGYHPMEGTYQYTDQYYDAVTEQLPEQWDFAGHPMDVVVINLGTNDSNPIRFAPDLRDGQAEEAFFRTHYRSFIEQIRACNGKKTLICCTLGSMDYYLYNEIENIVEAYRQETGDRNICCFKLRPINMMSEGYASAMHPSAKSHARMGMELASHLRDLMGRNLKERGENDG